MCAVYKAKMRAASLESMASSHFVGIVGSPDHMLSREHTMRQHLLRVLRAEFSL